MNPDKRKRWSLIVFIVIFVPVLIAFSLTLFYPGNRWGGATDTGSGGSPGAAFLSRPRMPGAAGGRASAPLLAAGGANALWVAHPVVLDADNGKVNGFEMLMRASDSGRWSAALVNGTSFWQEFPRCLAVETPAAGTAYVFADKGPVTAFGLDRKDSIDNLPADQTVVAAAGTAESLFALTYGPPGSIPPPTTATPTGGTASSGPTSGAATAPSSTAVGTAPARSPTTAQTAPAPDYNVARFHDGRWSRLAALGAPGEGGLAPAAQARTVLATTGERLLAAWIDAAQPDELVVRALDIAKPDGRWGPIKRSKLPEAIPADSRLLTTTLDQAVYILWTVPEGPSIALHGGWLVTDPAAPEDLTLPARNRVHPLSMGAVADGISPTTDVAIGPAENSLVVVVNRQDGSLASRVFDDRGNPLGDARAVTPRFARRDQQIGQSVLLLLLVLVLTLALWQWRQKPAAPALPKGQVAAPLHLRGLAFLIDAAVPYAVVLLLFNEWSDGVFSLLSTWWSALSSPEQLVSSPELYAFLGIYLAHVCVGELFFRRSVGKALVGLQVLMMDGRAPTVAAVLVRNLVRVPEMVFGVAVLYVLITEHRQRLGDLLARTLVVAPEPPPTPDDPDREK